MKELLKRNLTNPEGPLNNQEIKSIEQLKSGNQTNAYCLELNGGKKYFVKLTSNNEFSRLEFEAEGLKLLRKYSDQNLLEIPEPFYLNKFKDCSILIIPWINISYGDQSKLGAGLALLHKKSSEHNLNYFGWEEEGFIGIGKQPKGYCNKWGKFFIEYRLKPQIKIAQTWGLKIKKLNQLLNSLEEYLNKHNPLPSLVHGDLWSGNAYVLKDGKGVIIDPAISWADREVDIAMTKLFGGFDETFYKSYQEVWPLSSTFKERINIYNLYHILNHANIFGGSYKEQSISILNQLSLYTNSNGLKIS